MFRVRRLILRAFSGLFLAYLSPLPPFGLFIWRFVIGFLYLCCLLGPPLSMSGIR
jgi:hypothetical protein